MNKPRLSPEFILETCVYASDLGAARAFYADVMGLEVAVEEEGRHVFFRLGPAMFLVFNPAQTTIPSGERTQVTADIPPHGTHGAGHVAFQVSADSIACWKEHFLENGVEIERQIHWPHGGRSLFVRDPANNSVEVATPGIWRWTEE